MENDNATWARHWVRIADEFTQDEKIDSWFLMGSHWPIIAIFVLYIQFAVKSGPQIVKRLPKYDLTALMVMYNATQIYLNGALVFFHFWKAGLASFLWNASCANPAIFPRDREEALHLHEFHRGAWYYLVTKILDLMDTVFITMNGKLDRLTFLHIYHHSTMVLVVWFGFKYFRPVHAVYPGLLNNMAHVFMYTYYLVSLFKPGFGKRHKKVKMAITIFQMVQFFLILAYYLNVSYVCPVPKSIVYVLLLQNFMFLVLFGNFYIKQYFPGKKPKTQRSALKKKVT